MERRLEGRDAKRYVLVLINSLSTMNRFCPHPFYFKCPDGPTVLLALMATILPALAGVCTMWQAQARLGARGLVRLACPFS